MVSNVSRRVGLGFLAWMILAAPVLSQSIDPASSTTNWVAIKYPPPVRADYFSDQQTGSKEADIIGDTNAPSLYTQFASLDGPTATNGLMAFRVRLAREDTSPGYDGAFMVGIDGNGDGQLDVFAGLNNSGSSDIIGIWPAGNDLNISPNTTSIASSPLTNFIQSAANYSWMPVTALNDPETPSTDFDGDGFNDYFLSFVVPFEGLVRAMFDEGITNYNGSSPSRYVAITATQDNSFNQDINALSGGIGSSESYTNIGGITPPITPTGTPVNEPPIDLLLDPSSIPENRPVGTWIGALIAVDPNDGGTHTYTLVSGGGDDDNGSFAVLGDAVLSGEVFDYETKNSYSIRVRATDSGGLFFEKAFVIAVLDVNEPPTDFDMNGGLVPEHQPPGTLAGRFELVIDPDFGDRHSFTLVSGVGDNDNGSFMIVSNRLETAVPLDASVQSFYSIRVRVTDLGGLFYEEVFTVLVVGGNESPTDLDLSPGSVPENEPSGTVVGNFSVVDPDAGDNHLFDLVAGAGDADNGLFRITGGQLFTRASFNFEARNLYNIRVRVTDQDGLSYVEALTVLILDVNDAPVLVTPIPDQPGLYGSSSTYTFPVNTFTDEDVGQVLSYTASGLPPGIGFSSASRTFNGIPAAAGSYTVTVTATDNGAPVLSANDMFEWIVAPATLTVAAEDQSRVYGQSNPPLTHVVGGFVNGDTAAVLTGAPLLNTSATATSDVGFYPITVQAGTLAAANYTFTFVPGTLTILRASVVLNWPPPPPITYGTPLGPTQLNPTVSPIVPGTFLFTPTTGTVLPPGTNVLQVVFTPTQTNNYNLGTTTTELRVLPAILTVRADNQTRRPGEPNPPLTISYSGFVNGEDPSVLSVAPSATTSANLNSPPGLYAITASGGSSPNYAFIYQDGVLSVEVPLLAGLPSDEVKVGQCAPLLFELATMITAGSPLAFMIERVEFSGSGSNLTAVITAMSYARGPAMVEFTLTDSGGSQNVVTLPVVIFGPDLLVIREINGFATFNPQTSLFEQVVRVSNASTMEFPGFRVTVSGLPGSVRLDNATGTNSSGESFVERGLPLGAGQSVDLLLEYFSVNRAPFAPPILEVELITPGVAPAPTGTALAIDRMFLSADGRFYIEFSSVLGRWYYVQYAPSPSGPWVTSPSPIEGTGYRIHWIDSGPPKTATPPSGARYYQLIAP